MLLMFIVDILDGYNVIFDMNSASLMVSYYSYSEKQVVFLIKVAMSA